MQIHSVIIQSFIKGSMSTPCGGESHKKRLPTLSVVQAYEGEYGIGIDSPCTVQTGKCGVFVAPAEKMQYITHIPDSKSGCISAHWLFIDTLVNGTYAIDDLFDFPLILPEMYNSRVNDIISSVGKSGYCADLSLIYAVLDILVGIGIEKETEPSDVITLKRYISANLSQKIEARMLADVLYVSVPTLYRRISEYFGVSPSALVNSMRLTRASELLQTTDMKVKDIADAVGLPDVCYFTKLFSSTFGTPPMKYGKTNK